MIATTLPFGAEPRLIDPVRRRDSRRDGAGGSRRGLSPALGLGVLVAVSISLSSCTYDPLHYKAPATDGPALERADGGGDGPTATTADGSPTLAGDGSTTGGDDATVSDATAVETGAVSDGGGDAACGTTCDLTKRDGCCPSGCTAASDLDCLPRCGNNVLEPGETCDPASACPTACPNRGCTLFTLQGSAAACTATCVESGKQTACASDDGCCPAGCTANDDNDCLAVCDNGVKEGKETCDPLSSCPTTCAPQGCQLRKLVNPQSCTAECVNDRMQTACKSGDGCCPGGCNQTNDADCDAKCGNGVVEKGETCEPVAECQRQQAACQSDQNTIRTGSGNPAACTFQCAQSPRACGPADGVCPSGCSVDPDCLPRPTSCVHIQYCHKPTAPNQNLVICVTNDDPRCTDGERIAECAREATSVCGTGHAHPVVYDPPIGGRGTE